MQSGSWVANVYIQYIFYTLCNGSYELSEFYKNVFCKNQVYILSMYMCICKCILKTNYIHNLPLPTLLCKNKSLLISRACSVDWYYIPLILHKICWVYRHMLIFAIHTQVWPYTLYTREGSREKKGIWERKILALLILWKKNRKYFLNVN